MSDQNSMSFDRMRSMLMRAAEIRDSEQQQIFDSLDEIHARLATLDALGSMRKRLAELPDRTEASVLTERLDETVAKIDAESAVVATVARSVDALVDRLAKPFAQLDGRLDGMAGRMEGVAGRMDGLDDKIAGLHKSIDDKIAGLHKSIDDLDGRLDRHEQRLEHIPDAVTGPVRERVEGLDSALRGRLNEVDAGVRHQVDVTRDELRKSINESHDGVHATLDQAATGLRGQLEQTDTGLRAMLNSLSERPSVDPTEQLDGLATRLEALADRVGEITGRLDTVDSALGSRPDTDSLTALVTKANQESEKRNAGQLDEAMATFAEIILGRGPGSHAAQMPMPTPRSATRRAPRTKASAAARNGVTTDDAESDSGDS